jgi:predicted ATPase/DNA-binding SARP family transcriptional activator
LPTASPIPAATLPVQLTEFVGREHDVETLLRLLPQARLLTLTGAGGSGKTRLALATVTRLRDEGEPDSAWIELASLSDPSSLATHVALALGARAEGGGSSEQAVTAVLRGRPFLLVLDNCEHLVDECARLVERLLRACPDLRVLATSREALGISGERSWLVPALSLPVEAPEPTPEEVLGAESVQLFVARARDVLPDFELTAANARSVSQICRRLDGLPLAIELAAARARVLTPEQIAERLQDRFGLLTSTVRSALPRHRTLRAAVDWSYDLLPEAERVLLERLSVFSGGFTLDAAEHVCVGGSVSGSDVLDLLASLVTRSLVSMQEAEGRARYRLLETIREYAAAKLAQRPDAGAPRARHARYFMELARDAAPDLLLGRAHRLHHMDVEQDNLRAALDWSAEHEEGSAVGLPLCEALMWYWFHRQLWREGFRHFSRALESATEPEPRLRGAALHGLGLYGLYAGDPGSRARLTEAEAIWRHVGDARWLSFTLLVRTVEASLRGDPVEARGLANAAVAAARDAGDPWVVALATAHALVPVLVWEGDWQGAESALAEAERVYREHEYEIGVAYVLDARAFVTLQLGDHQGAVALAHASLRHSPLRENRWLAGRSLRILAAAAFAQGQPARAARLFGAADAMYEAIGALSLTAERRAVNQLPPRVREAMGDAAFDAEAAAGARLSFAEAVELALEGAAEEPRLVAATAPAHAADTEAPPPLAVRALGPLEITVLGALVPSEAWSYAKPRELLLYLLAHPEGRTREQIGLDFWPEASQARVKNNFHVTLHHVRKAVARSDLIRYERGRYRVALEEGVDFDAARFERLVTEALRGGRGARDAAAAAGALEEALSLYRGPFLETEPMGDWHLATRDRLARLHEEAWLALGTLREAAGDHPGAGEAYARLVAADPLHEEAVRRLARALARGGRRAEALRAMDRLERDLATELDAEPEAETLELAALIRRGETP